MAKKVKKSKRFRYNLATVLKVRNIKEKQAQEVYNAAQKKLEEEKKKEAELRAKETQAYADFRAFMEEGDLSDIGEINRHKAHLDVLKEKIIEQVKAVEAAIKAVEEARLALIDAVKERKILEKDKEQKREEWRKLMDKEAGKFLDELSSVKYAKKTGDAKDV